MLRKLLILLCVLQYSMSVAAQSAISEMIHAERSFAKMAVEKNIRDAFLAYMCDRSVVELDSSFEKGIPAFQKRDAHDNGKLIWWPSFAAIASSGDIGYSTGPWKYNSENKDVAFGNFATVWQKQPDGSWKFLIDLGNYFNEADQVSQGDSVQLLLPGSTQAGNKDNDLISVDRAFSDAVNTNTTEVYTRYMHPQAHILRGGWKPLVSEASKKLLSTKKQSINFSAENSYISNAKDLGVVYGTCRINSGKTSVYMHVWRKDQRGQWQLLHETIK